MFPKSLIWLSYSGSFMTCPAPIYFSASSVTIFPLYSSRELCIYLSLPGFLHMLLSAKNDLPSPLNSSVSFVLSLIVTSFSCHFFPGPPSMGQEPFFWSSLSYYLFYCAILPIYLSTHPYHFSHTQIVEQGSANLLSQGPDSKYF